MPGAWWRAQSQWIWSPALRTIGLADGDRGDTEQGALHRGGDGARIGHILGDVLAAIDAGEDQVRPRLDQDRAHGHDDAIGRRALNRKTLR